MEFNPPIRLLAAFQQALPDRQPEWIIRAPGRDVWIAAARSNNDQFTLIRSDQDGRVTFSLQSARLRQTVLRRPLPRWAHYPAGVTLMLSREGLDLIGLVMVVIADEPPGPRHDYGLGMAFAALWHELYALPFTVDDLIDIVDRTRRDYASE